MPGTHSGSVMRNNTPRRDAPSMVAASSSSTGTARMYPLNIHTLSGSVRIV